MVTHRSERIRLLHLELDGLVDIAFTNIVGKKVSFELLLLGWNRKENGHHWIECDRDSITLGAGYCALELSVEQVSDDGLVP